MVTGKLYTEVTFPETNVQENLENFQFTYMGPLAIKARSIFWSAKNVALSG